MLTALRAFVVVPIFLILFASLGLAYAQEEDTDANEACPSAPDVYVYVSGVPYLEKVNGKVNLYGRKCVDYESGDKAAEGICTGPRQCKANLCDGKPCALPKIKIEDVKSAVYDGKLSAPTTPASPSTPGSLLDQWMFNPTPLGEQKGTIAPSANALGDFLKQDSQPGFVDGIGKRFEGLRNLLFPPPEDKLNDTVPLSGGQTEDFGPRSVQTTLEQGGKAEITGFRQPQTTASPETNRFNVREQAVPQEPTVPRIEELAGKVSQLGETEPLKRLTDADRELRRAWEAVDASGETIFAKQQAAETKRAEFEQVVKSLGGRIDQKTGNVEDVRFTTQKDVDRYKNAFSEYKSAYGAYTADPTVVRSETAAKEYNTMLETAKPALEEYKQAAAEYRAEYDKQQLSQRQYIDSLESPHDMQSAALRAEAEKAQALAEATRKTQAEVTAKATWGIGLGFNCYAGIVCQTVTDSNGVTTPLSTYEAQAKALIYEQEAKAAKLTRLSEFFVSSDPLAEKIAQTPLDERRSQLVLKNVDDMLEARSRIGLSEPASSFEYLADDHASRIATEKQATIERLISGGDLTAAERSFLYPSTMSVHAIDLDSQRQRLMDSNLAHAPVVGRVVTSLYDAIRLTGDPTAQQLQQIAFMTETQISEQKFGAWQNVVVSTALSTAEAYLFFTPGGLALSGAALKAVTPEFVASGVGRGLGLAWDGVKYVAPETAGILRGWAASGGIAGDFVEYNAFRTVEFKPAFASELDAFGARVVRPYIEQEQGYIAESVAKGIAPDIAEATAYRNLYSNIAGTDIAAGTRGSEILSALEQEMAAKNISIPVIDRGKNTVASSIASGDLAAPLAPGRSPVVYEAPAVRAPELPSAPALPRVESPPIVPPAEPGVPTVTTPKFTPTAEQMNNLTRELVPPKVPVAAAEVDVVKSYNNALETNAAAQAAVKAGRYEADALTVRAARDDLLVASRQLEEASLYTRLAPLDAEGVVPIDRIYRAGTGEVIAERVAPIASEEAYQILGQELRELQGLVGATRPISPSPFRSPLQAAADFNSGLRLNSAGGSAFSPLRAPTAPSPQRSTAPTLLAERPAFNNPLMDLLNPSKLPLAPELTAAEKRAVDLYGSTDGVIRNLRQQGISPSTPLFNSYSRQLAEAKTGLTTEGLRMSDITGAIYKGEAVVAVQKPAVFPGESPYAIVAPLAEPQDITTPFAVGESPSTATGDPAEQNVIPAQTVQENALPPIAGTARNPGLELEIVYTSDPAPLPTGIRQATDADVTVYSRADAWDPFLATRDEYMPVLIDTDGRYIPTSKIDTGWLPGFRRIIDTPAKYEAFINQYLRLGSMPLQIAIAEPTSVETGIGGEYYSYKVVHQVSVSTFDGTKVLINRDIYEAILDKGDALYGVPALEAKIDDVTRGRLTVASSYDFPERAKIIPTDDADKLTPLLPSKRAVFLDAILREARKYPREFWQNSRTFTLYYFESAAYVDYAGRAFVNGNEMWLDPADTVPINFHHELTHINDAPFRFLNDEEWASTIYGASEQWAYGKQGSNTYTGYRPAGFARAYGTTKVFEDPTTLSEEMFDNYAALEEATSRDPILAIKVDRMKDAYAKVSDGVMNDAYWESLVPISLYHNLEPLLVDPYQVQTAYTVANGVQRGIIALRNGLESLQQALFAPRTEAPATISAAQQLSPQEKQTIEVAKQEAANAEPIAALPRPSLPENVDASPRTLLGSLANVPNMVRTAVVTAMLSNPVVADFLNIISPVIAEPNQIASLVQGKGAGAPTAVPAASVPASVPPPVNIQPQGKTVASIFGTPNDKLKGNNTMASGQRIDQTHSKGLYVVAHKTLPFGTEVIIRNPVNGKTVVAQVGERGPYVAGRELDLFETVAKELGFGIGDKGVIAVEWAIIPNSAKGVTPYKVGRTDLGDLSKNGPLGNTASLTDAGTKYAEAFAPKTVVAGNTVPAVTPLPPPAPARVAPSVRPPVTITTPEEPFTLAAYKIPPPASSKTVAELRDTVGEVANQIEAANQELANLAQQRIPVTQQIDKIQSVARGKENLATAKAGLEQLKTLKTPDAKELAVMTAGTSAATQLAGVVRQLGNQALSSEVNRYVATANALKKPENQTLALANQAIAQGDALIAKAQSFLGSVDTGPKNIAVLQKSLQELDAQQASIKTSVAELAVTQRQAQGELVLAIKADAEAAAAARLAEATEAMRVGEKIPESVLMTAEESELAIQRVAQAEPVAPTAPPPSAVAEYLNLGKTLAQVAQNTIADQLASLQGTISAAFTPAPAGPPVRLASVTAAPEKPYMPRVVQYAPTVNAPSAPLPTMQARFSNAVRKPEEPQLTSGSGGARPETSPVPEPTLYILAGGTSAGKTTVAENVLPRLNPTATIIDNASLDAAGIARNVNDALAAGKVPNVVYVHRNPVEAFDATVPIDAFAESYTESWQAVKGLLENKALQEEGLQVTLLDNSRGLGNAVPMTPEAFNALPRPSLAELKQQLLAKTDAMYETGAIDAEQYAALTGTEAPVKKVSNVSVQEPIFARLDLPAGSPVQSLEVIPVSELNPDTIAALKNAKAPVGYTYLYRGLTQPYTSPSALQYFSDKLDAAVGYTSSSKEGDLVRIAIPSRYAYRISLFNSYYQGPLTQTEAAVYVYPPEWFAASRQLAQGSSDLPTPEVPATPAPTGPIEAGWLGSEVGGQVAWFKSLPDKFTRGINEVAANVFSRIPSIPAIPEPTYQPITPIPTSRSLVPNTVGQGPARPVTSPLAQQTPTQYVNAEGVASPEVGKVMKFYPWKQLSAPPARPAPVGNLNTANPPAVIALGEQPIGLLPSPSSIAPPPVRGWTPSPNLNRASPPSVIEAPAPAPILPEGYANWYAQGAEQDVLFGTPPARSVGPTPAENTVPVHNPPVTTPAPARTLAPWAELKNIFSSAGRGFVAAMRGGGPTPVTPTVPAPAAIVPAATVPTSVTPAPVTPAPVTPTASAPAATVPAATQPVSGTPTLVLKVLRGTILPGDVSFKPPFGIVRNTVLNGGSYWVAGPAAPLVNMGYRFVMNSGYRADVLGLIARIRGTAPAPAAVAPAPASRPTIPAAQTTPASAVTEMSREQFEVLAGPITDAQAAELGFTTTATLPDAMTREQLEILTGRTYTDAEFNAMIGGGGGSGGVPPGGTPPTGGTGNGGGAAWNTAKATGAFCSNGLIRFGICAGVVGYAYSQLPSFSASPPAGGQQTNQKPPDKEKTPVVKEKKNDTTAPPDTTRRTAEGKPCGPNDTYASSGCYPPYVPPGTRGSDIPSPEEYCITSIDPLVVVPGVKPGPNCYNYSGGATAPSRFGSILGQLLGRLFGTSAPTSAQPTQPTRPPVTVPSATSTPAKPYATLVANPSTVTAGGKARLIWASVGTSGCELFGQDNSLMATGTRGSTSTLPLATTTPFTLQCSAPSSATTVASTTVTVR